MSEPRLSIIPGWVVCNPQMKPRDLQVLCVLGMNTNKRDGWCRRSQVKMAEQIDCARSTVQASIERLVQIGAVERREVVSKNGRDSAHWYRVIYDRPTDSNAFSAWDEDESELSDQEFGPIADMFEGHPPADISAPPAGPESAPPAGPGPAPINVSRLTPPAEREERERERNDGDEENPKAIERDFKRFFIGWKTAISDSEPEARHCWRQLTAEERVAAGERSADYQAAALSTGRKHLCSAAKYLRERRWEKLPELKVQAQNAAPEPYTAYSRAGRALLFAELLRPERILRLNAIEEKVVSDHPEKAELIWRDKREKQGWPEAVKLIETTMQRKRFHVPPRIVDIAQDFDKVKVGGEIWEAWKRLHHRRCWPWLPAPDVLEYAQFPRLPDDNEADLDGLVEEALARFQQTLIEVRGNDAA